MDIRRFLKKSENDTGERSAKRKRADKSTRHSYNKILKSGYPQMGVGMLDSEDSSSCSPLTDLSVKISNSENDENGKCTMNNSDEITQYANELVKALQAGEIEVDDANFIDPNETLVPSSYKLTGNSTIEIYTDSGGIGKRNRRQTGNLPIKGRNPLKTVACNNNHNNINQNSNGGTDANLVKKQVYVPDEAFFLYRKCVPKPLTEKDYFELLSDEIILNIFKWLPKKTLIRCSYVCRRFNQLSQDESLWTRLDLGGKSLKSGALDRVVSRGVIVLRLAQAEIADPAFNINCLDTQLKLQYLDLSMIVISKTSLKILLSRCRKLKKLSLEHVPLNSEICLEISKNIQLEALNLAMCEGINNASLQEMVRALLYLHSLNISWTGLSSENVSIVVDNVTPNLLRLNIAGCRKSMQDFHLQSLVKRCKSLLELDLSDCTALSAAAIPLICKLNDLEYLSLSRCYSIPASAYMQLKHLSSLKFLDVFGLLSDSDLNTLQNTFPYVSINKFIHSSVARPTVGTRRTSIWGLRTRD